MTKFFSFLGILVILLSRDLILNGNGSNWRLICLVPAIIALVGVFFIASFLRESDVFLDQRIAYLEKPYEERLKEVENKKHEKEVNTNKGGIGTAIKYVFNDKQLRSIVLAMGLFLLGMGAFVGFTIPSV